jgi:hypothetical protein
MRVSTAPLELAPELGAQLVAFLGQNLANGFHRDPERVVSGPLDPGGDIVRPLLAERIRRRYRRSAALPLSKQPRL